LSALRAEVAELAERVDFAERLLGSVRYGDDEPARVNESGRVLP
jgi:hypothetical protein